MATSSIFLMSSELTTMTIFSGFADAVSQSHKPLQKRGECILQTTMAFRLISDGNKEGSSLKPLPVSSMTIKSASLTDAGKDAIPDALSR